MAVTLISSTSATVLGGGSITTSPGIDTSGATLLVMHVAAQSIVAGAIGDSKSNTWTTLASNGSNGFSQLFCAINPTVGTGHTFSVTGTGIFAVLSVVAFSGIATTSPVDTQSSANSGVGGVGLHPGLLSPSVAGELFVSGYEVERAGTITVDSSFTITDQSPFLPGTSYGGALAYKVSSGSENPFWNVTGTGREGATMVTFIPTVDVASSDTITISDSPGQGRGYLFQEGLAFSDAALDSVTGSVPGGDLVGDFINLKDSAAATFVYSPPGGQRGNIDYDQIRRSARSGDGAKLHTLTGSITTGHGVVFDANGNLVDDGGGGGSGTVTSVAQTVPSILSISGSPVTTSGTLAIGLQTQNANIVFAGPTTGGAATPTFRAVVAADLPLGSSSAFGAVKVDNTTITAAAGVITAVLGAAPALVLREQHTASTSATLDFTTFYSSSYDEYMIEIVNLIPDTNNIQGLITVSTDGGSNWATTTYYARLFYFFGASSGIINGAASSWPFTGTTLSSDTHLGAVGSIKLFSPGSASLYKMITGECNYYDGSNDLIKVSIAGRWSTSTAVNALRFAPSSGNWTSGTIRIYGLTK